MIDTDFAVYAITVAAGLVLQFQLIGAHRIVAVAEVKS